MYEWLNEWSFVICDIYKNKTKNCHFSWNWYESFQSHIKPSTDYKDYISKNLARVLNWILN